jgi:hypothetical protein
MESGMSSGLVAMKLILVDKRSKTTFQLDAEIWKIIRPTYLAMRSLTACGESTSDLWVFSYSALAAAICDVDLMLIFPSNIELAEGRPRSEGSAGGGRGGDGIDLTAAAALIITVSSKFRKEVSVDRAGTVRGISELAVWRMNTTMTLKMYLMQESSRGGGSSHDDDIEEEAGDPSSTIFAEESSEGERRVQREAIVMESTFKISNCD